MINIPLWRERIVNLLDAHTIRFAGNPNFYLIHMKEDRDDKVHGYTFAPVSSDT